MIEKRINVLSEYLSEQKNVPWRVKEAFNNLLDHCTFLDNNYKDKTKYLERLASWYIDHMIELNEPKLDKVSYDFIKHILLDRLAFILNTPSEYNYLSIENNIRGINIENDNKINGLGEVSEAISLFVKDVLVFNTKDYYGTAQN
jgi:hypothetical protein